MAPRTGLQLLHTAALLVMVAYLSSGSVLASDAVFSFEEFANWNDNRCMLQQSGFVARSLMVAEPVWTCVDKAYMESPPAECASLSFYPRSFNCIANSVPHFVTVDGVKSFDTSLLETWLHTFSSNVTLQGYVSGLLQRCQQKALPTLTPQQLALYSYNCLFYSVMDDCESTIAIDIQPLYDMPDYMAFLRRERFLKDTAQMIVAAFGPPADTQWTACSRLVPTGDYSLGDEEAQRRYVAIAGAVTCLLLQDYNLGDGVLNSRAFLDKAALTFPAEFSAAVQALEAACGPDVPAYQSVTAPEFVHCWAAEGVALSTWHQANQEAAAMPETCVISVSP